MGARVAVAVAEPFTVEMRLPFPFSPGFRPP